MRRIIAESESEGKFYSETLLQDVIAQLKRIADALEKK